MSVLANAPQLKPGKADYVGASFSSELRTEKNSLLISHALTSGNLVFNLLQENKASYACEVISPRSSFRKLYIAAPDDGVSQRIDLEPGQIVREDTLIRPLVISKIRKSFVGSSEHGLNSFMQGFKFDFNEGSIIAEGDYQELEAKYNKLFLIRSDEKLKPGSYRIDHQEKPNFVFIVRMARELYREYYKAEKQGKLGERMTNLFMTGVFASALSYLRKIDKPADDPEEEGEGDIVERHAALLSLFDLLDTHEPNSWEAVKTDEAAPTRLASACKPISFVLEND